MVTEHSCARENVLDEELQPRHARCAPSENDSLGCSACSDVLEVLAECSTVLREHLFFELTSLECYVVKESFARRREEATVTQVEHHCGQFGGIEFLLGFLYLVEDIVSPVAFLVVFVVEGRIEFIACLYVFGVVLFDETEYIAFDA